MKKNSVINQLLLISIVLTASLFSAEQKREITHIKKQTDKIEPTPVKRINTLQKAINVLDHSAYCLLTNSKCTSSDRLKVQFALGFIVATTSNMYLFARLMQSRDISNKWAVTAGQLAGESALAAAKIKGPLLTPLTSALQQAILSALFLIGDVKQAIEQAATEESVITFLREISRYLAQDAKCIWSEKYCKIYGGDIIEKTISLGSEVSAAARKREALYFWMGIISGITTKEILRSEQTQKKLGS